MPSLDVNQVARTQQSAGHFFKAAIGLVALGNGLTVSLAERVCLRLAAAFRHGFSKVRKQDREPQPKRDLKIEPNAGALMNSVLDQQYGGKHTTDFNHEHHRIPDHAARIKLAH